MNEKKESKVYGKEYPSNDSLTHLLRLTICLGTITLLLLIGTLQSTVGLLEIGKRSAFLYSILILPKKYLSRDTPAHST
ncbi:hypothetical protein Y032_0129g1504 [Ancylostoma ceylanicum]|uniref:Uncharacterized protein n=1 Tax=Ancylostoma ceylanicum TaxID=53326 RepID=A0A016T7S4_9BILA|nr:hypothetical protein Y032_0129g1504 [Ancylostoma ceylanicum]